jgi:MYXO-CTERM domain-containing protein
MACGGGACGEAFCSAGQCLSGGETVCEDDNPCTWDHCDPESGCVYEPMPDHSACSACGECLASVCIQDPDCLVVEGGCGCNASAAHPSLAGLLLLLYAFRRRKT